jgi:hypothetical protein
MCDLVLVPLESPVLCSNHCATRALIYSQIQKYMPLPTLYDTVSPPPPPHQLGFQELLCAGSETAGPGDALGWRQGT